MYDIIGIIQRLNWNHFYHILGRNTTLETKRSISIHINS